MGIYGDNRRRARTFFARSACIQRQAGKPPDSWGLAYLVDNALEHPISQSWPGVCKTPLATQTSPPKGGKEKQVRYLKRWTTGVFSRIDSFVSQVENHEALANEALKNLQQTTERVRGRRSPRYRRRASPLEPAALLRTLRVMSFPLSAFL